MDANSNHPSDELLAKWAARAEKMRLQELNDTPSLYNPWVHLMTTVGVCSAVAVHAATRLSGVSLVEFITIPAVFLFANAFEWWVHQDVLHKKFPGFHILYEKHTPMHHSVYTPQDMRLRSTKEMRLVMIPAVGIIGIVAILGALTPLLNLIAGANVAYLFLATTTSYVALYEISHLLYHVNPDSFLGRLPGIAFLRQHHTIHHDPRIMQDWNFNVTVPLFDILLGTSTKNADEVATPKSGEDQNATPSTDESTAPRSLLPPVM